MQFKKSLVLHQFLKVTCCIENDGIPQFGRSGIFPAEPNEFDHVFHLPGVLKRFGVFIPVKKSPAHLAEGKIAERWNVVVVGEEEDARVCEKRVGSPAAVLGLKEGRCGFYGDWLKPRM